MSIHWSTYGWKAGPANAHERIVYLALADNASDEGIAFPSIHTIVSKTRLSESTVRRCIISLVANGWLEIERGKGRGHHSHYKLKKVSDRGHLSGAIGVTLTGERCQSDGEKVSRGQPKAVTLTEPPHPHKGVTVIEPSMNRQGNCSALAAQLAPGRAALVSVNSDRSAEMQAAAWLFEELETPSDFATRDLAAQAIRLQARQWGGVQQAAEMILVSAKAAKAMGQTRWRFWFLDSGYLRNSAPVDRAASRDKKWEEFMKTEDGDAPE